MPSTLKTLHLLPRQITSVCDVTERYRPLYDIDPVRDGYSLTPGGNCLRRYREAVASGDIHTEAPPKRPSRLTKTEWTMLLGVAQPEERPHFLRAAARGHIKIEG